MFLGNPLPTWKQIINHNKSRGCKTYYEELFPNALMLSESCMSIRLIVNAIKECMGKTTVKLLLPDYFCNQTTYSFNEEWLELIFYPIKSDMNPDWDFLKSWTKENDFDAFIFTHYFGKYFDSISRAKELCKNHEAILIEDCAHVLYPTRKMGTSGDFVIFSPHKQLPIMDGGVLVCNESEQKPVVADFYKWIHEKHESLPQSAGSSSWYVKKALQKLLPIHRGLTYYPGVHNSTDHGQLHDMEKISNGSYNILCDFKYIDYKKAAYIRRDNLEMMNYIISQKYSDILPLLDAGVDAPYFAVYSLKNVPDKEKTVREMIVDGFTVLYWPDLPYQLNGVEGHEAMQELSENIIVIPIHQGLNQQKMVRGFLGKEEKAENNANRITEIEWLDNNEDAREKYNSIFNQVDFSNIPQNWDYGDVKHDTEDSGLLRGIIKARDDCVGITQLLIKRKCKLPIAVRVNRGPLFIDGYDTIENHITAMDMVRSKVPHPIPISYASNLEASVKSIEHLAKHKWKQWNHYGYETGIINLNASIEEIRKNLDSKWRNQLKASEKMNLEIIEGFDRFDEILDIYESSQKEKHYDGIPRNVLCTLKELRDCPLKVFYITNANNSIIVFDIFYFTDNFGLYFVGWNDDEGRKMYVNNILLYKAAETFKEKGCKWLDLGGIDYIDTEENARFKDGMKPKHVRTAGEFIRF